MNTTTPESADTAKQIAAAFRHSVDIGHQILERSERMLLLQGKTACLQLPRQRKIRNLSEVEFRVFSQWGEDGIIEWLINHVVLPNHRFIEFGVENFCEASCRFLLLNRNWRGLVIDGSQQNIDAIGAAGLFWRHDVSARCAFVTAENIGSIIQSAGFAGPAGVLSIDVDGNDYWIWKALEIVDPAIVVCEYNAVLGDRYALTVPYDPDFTRLAAHPSGLYFGASIRALSDLAASKGYVFVGTGSSGVNAFFVKRELAETVLSLLEETLSFPSLHRESRDHRGELSYASGVDRLRLIGEMPVMDTQNGRTLRLADIEEPYSQHWLGQMT